jgi:hypothetical protein
VKSDQTATTAPTAQSSAGLPESLKSALGGLIDGTVAVHYNSPKPLEISAHAYAQDSAIHVGPGQEQDLAQARIRPVRQRSGVALNDDRALEREADKLGTVAATSG